MCWEERNQPERIREDRVCGEEGTKSNEMSMKSHTDAHDLIMLTENLIYKAKQHQKHRHVHSTLCMIEEPSKLDETCV